MARATAFSGELMLLRWSDTSTGGRTVTFQVDEESDTHPFRDYAIKSGKRAGQRFAAVLVELGPDDQPIGDPPTAKSGSLARSAAMVCQNEDFQQWIVLQSAEGPANYAGNSMEEIGAQFIRYRCGVLSRAELDSQPAAAERFHALMREFNVWKDQQIG